MIDLAMYHVLHTTHDIPLALPARSSHTPPLCPLPIRLLAFASASSPKFASVDPETSERAQHHIST